MKRSAEGAFASSKAAFTVVPGVGGKATTDRPVFGETPSPAHHGATPPPTVESLNVFGFYEVELIVFKGL